MIFSVVLTKNAMILIALRQGGYPHVSESSCWLEYLMGSTVAQCSGVSTPIIYLPFPTQKGKKRESDNWDFFKNLKAL